MATYRPIKKWLIPVLAATLGTLIGFSFFPSKQEYHYQEWNQHLDEMRSHSFQIETTYDRDDSIYSESRGHWSEERANYHIATPVTDDSTFEFDLYLDGSKFYIFAGDEWAKGEAPHRILEEIVPLEDPFSWSKEMVKEADNISKEKHGDTVTYQATFQEFNDYEFRGVLLKKQHHTTLTMTLHDGFIHSISLKARPKRPEEVPILNSYPETLTYSITLSRHDAAVPDIPKEAFSGKILE